MQEGRAALQASIMDQLPLDLTHKKHTAAAAAATEVAHAVAQASPSSLAALPTIEEGEDDGSPPPQATTPPKTGPALSIAWQYQKYMGGGDGSSTSSSSGGGGGGGSFCHSYDLSRPMQPELRLAEGGGPRPAVIDVGELLDSRGESQYARVYRAVERAVKALPPRTVLRVLVKSLLDRRGAWDLEKGWCVRRALSVMVFLFKIFLDILWGSRL